MSIQGNAFLSQGFIDDIPDDCAVLFPDGVAIIGQGTFKKDCTGNMCVDVRVQFPATSSASDG